MLRMRRQSGIEPQLIALSAVIGDTNGLERWLGGRLLRRLQRPVPLDEGILLADGTFQNFGFYFKIFFGNLIQRDIFPLQSM